jgi:hypothetical protein
VLFGAAGADQPVPVDFDGDGRADIATFRPGTAEWFILRSSLPYATAGLWMQFGAPGDIPAPAEYSQPSTINLAVYRPSSSEWLIRSLDGGPDQLLASGTSASVPILAPLSYRLPAPPSPILSAFAAASLLASPGQVLSEPQPAGRDEPAEPATDQAASAPDSFSTTPSFSSWADRPIAGRDPASTPPARRRLLSLRARGATLPVRWTNLLRRYDA